MKTLWNIFGGLVAFVLSIVLVVSMIVCPVISFVTDSLDPSFVVKIVVEGGLLNGGGQASYDVNIRLADGPGAPFDGLPFDPSFFEDIDLSALEDALETLMESDILNPEELMEAVQLPEGTQVDEEKLMTNLFKSDLVQTLVSTYAGDIVDAALGIEKDPSLTKDTVTSLLKPHVSEIVEIVRESLPEGTVIDGDKITQTVDKVVEEALPELVETLPPAQEIAQEIAPEDNAELQQALSALRFVRTGTLRLCCIGLLVLLAVLIFLFRLPRFSGLRWVGTDGLFCALILGAGSYALQMKELLSSIAQAAGNAAPLVTELISSLAGTLITFAIIYGVAGLVLVIAAGVLKAVFARR